MYIIWHHIFQILVESIGSKKSWIWVVFFPQQPLTHPRAVVARRQAVNFQGEPQMCELDSVCPMKVACGHTVHQVFCRLCLFLIFPETRLNGKVDVFIGCDYVWWMDYSTEEISGMCATILDSWSVYLNKHMLNFKKHGHCYEI